MGRREVGIVVSEGAIQRLPEEGRAAHELATYDGNGTVPTDGIGPTEATRAARAARRRGAMLRRLLALADFAAIALALWVAYGLVMDASPSALLWVSLASGRRAPPRAEPRGSVHDEAITRQRHATAAKSASASSRGVRAAPPAPLAALA